MGDTSETNTKVLSRELFLGVVALKTPIPQNHYLRDKVPFLKSGHIYIIMCMCLWTKKNWIHTLAIDSLFQIFVVELLIEFID